MSTQQDDTEDIERYNSDDLFAVPTLSAFDSMNESQFYVYFILCYEQFIAKFIKGSAYDKGVGYLSRRTGFSKAKVRKILRELHDMGWIRAFDADGTKSKVIDVLKAPKHGRPGNIDLPTPRGLDYTPVPKPVIDTATDKPAMRTVKPKLCRGHKQDGLPCTLFAKRGEEHCRHHSDRARYGFTPADSDTAGYGSTLALGTDLPQSRYGFTPEKDKIVPRGPDAGDAGKTHAIGIEGSQAVEEESLNDNALADIEKLDVPTPERLELEAKLMETIRTKGEAKVREVAKAQGIDPDRIFPKQSDDDDDEF